MQHRTNPKASLQCPADPYRGNLTKYPVYSCQILGDEVILHRGYVSKTREVSGSDVWCRDIDPETIGKQLVSKKSKVLWNQTSISVNLIQSTWRNGRHYKHLQNSKCFQLQANRRSSFVLVVDTNNPPGISWDGNPLPSEKYLLKHTPV